MNSLRGRITAFTLLATLGLSLAAGFLLDHTVEAQLRQALDRALEARSETMVNLTEQVNGKALVEFDEIYLPNLNQRELIEVRLAGGKYLARIPDLGAAQLVADGRKSMAPRFSDMTMPSGSPGRQVQIDFLPLVEIEDELDGPNGPDDLVVAPAAPPDHPSAAEGRPVVTVLVAFDSSDTLRHIHDFRVKLGLVSVLLLAALALLVPWLVGRGMKPLVALGEKVQRLDVANLGEKLELADPPRELQPLVAHLDDLRGRLARSFERERRFSSDVAHELRTPIAELRTLSEVALRFPPEGIQNAEFYGDVRQAALRMEHLAEQLLALARLQEPSSQPRLGPLRLLPAVSAALARHSAGEILSPAVPEEAEIPTQATLFELLLDNLIGNAFAHRTPGTPVEIAARPSAAGWRLTCSNLTDQLEEADLEHLFERFWRKDTARTGGRHSGLGMALIRSAAASLGIGLEVGLAAGVFSVSLEIPAPR
jgi:signal transduction histidine kinase